MRDSEIKEKLLLIVETFVKELDSGLTLLDQLHFILSESIVALEYISTIEDEFEIEFDDDDIGLDFFLNIENVVSKIQVQLQDLQSDSTGLD